MINKLQQALTEILRQHVINQYSIELSGQPLFEIPDDRKWGELSCRAAFILSKKIKKEPLKIAQEISNIFHDIDLIKKIEIAGNGYLNIYLDRKKYLEQYCSSLYKDDKFSLKEKIIIEHTNINPNKSAHVGHIRNACLGDTLARLAKFLGYNVEVQNYIDDTGVQLADVIVGFIFIDRKTIDEIKQIEKLDYYCWDLYSKVNAWYEENENNLAKRYEVLKAIESGNNEIAEVAHYVSTQIVRAHISTMQRLGITYDLLTKESDIIALKFWDDAFNLLKRSNSIQYCADGKYAGCWIMPFSEHPELSALSEPDKILVRSNGTLTYVAKDIAYQMWKFGLLNRDFYYRQFYRYPDNHVLWQSCSSFIEDFNINQPSFGKADRVYNVIDVRQSYLQKIVYESLKLIGFTQQAEKSVHFSYEVVALSPKTCKEMNISSEINEKKDFIGMSGRKGIGIKADDFIDMVEKKSFQEIESRNPSIPKNEINNIAKLIAAAAIRYYMLKFSRNKIIVFDIEEALNFDGETGPYLQYAAVRANNILNKLREKNFQIPPLAESVPHYIEDNFYSQDFLPIWDLIFNLSLIKNVAIKSLDTLELLIFAKFIYSLAQKFNYFYYHYDVIHMNDEERMFRSFIVNLFKHQYSNALNILGIPIPPRM